jgi:hypothetical protein
MQLVEKAEYIYNSNALDGITLSFDQTKSLVLGEIDPLAERSCARYIRSV